MTDQWFNIYGAHHFDLCPPGVNAEDWRHFHQKFKQTEGRLSVGHPVQLDVELNGGCNMKCPFCTHGYQTVENKLLPFPVYDRLVCEAVDLGIRSLKLNYINEPLMRRDLEEHIEHATDRGIFNTYFVTNGLLLTSKRRKRLLSTRLTKLFCSIDAATPETYDKQRTDKRFKTVTNNVRSFIEERNALGREWPKVLVSFLINKNNEHEREAFLQQWTGVADIISFQRMNEVPEQNTGLTLDYPEPDAGCKFPFKQLVVDHLGNIMPCCKLAGKKLSLGNVDHVSLATAWSYMQHLRDKHAGEAWRDFETCRNCLKCS
jgi:radical SAM protein with 4Fe4S-binding SPASM domain